jgi:hypothetical protein
MKKSLSTAWFDFSLQTVDMGGNVAADSGDCLLY